MVRRQGGIARRGKPDSPGTVSTQEIDDLREKLSCNTLTSIAVIDREAEYLSGGGVPHAVAHYSAIVYALPELYASRQHMGSEGEIFSRGGAEVPDMRFGQLSWAKFQIHVRPLAADSLSAAAKNLSIFLQFGAARLAL